MSLAGRVGVALALTAAASAAGQELPRVLIETEAGEILLEVDIGRAPVTAANFLRYVGAGLYDGGSFYRVVRMDNQPDDEVRIEVIQGGMNRERREEALPPIPMEGTGTTGLRHRDGTLSMARGGRDTARAEFFICIGDQPELDEGGRRHADGHGFAAFGRVLGGMEVVRAILSGAAQRQRLTVPIRIVTARRVS